MLPKTILLQPDYPESEKRTHNQPHAPVHSLYNDAFWTASPPMMKNEDAYHSNVARALHRFFERRIAALSGDTLPPPYANISPSHLASHLVERTLAHASLEAAVLSNGASETADRDLRLRVTALTVLRSLDL